jgi:hypothetical protein
MTEREIKDRLREMRKAARERPFGAQTWRQEQEIRHGYLLALEELETALTGRPDDRRD